MSESNGNHRKRYLNHLKGRSKPTCLIHVPRHSSYAWKVLGDFGFNYAKNSHTKDCGNYPTNRKKFNIQEENTYIVNSAVDEILLK